MAGRGMKTIFLIPYTKQANNPCIMEGPIARVSCSTSLEFGFKIFDRIFGWLPFETKDTQFINKNT